MPRARGSCAQATRAHALGAEPLDTPSQGAGKKVRAERTRAASSRQRKTDALVAHNRKRALRSRVLARYFSAHARGLCTQATPRRTPASGAESPDAALPGAGGTGTSEPRTARLWPPLGNPASGALKLYLTLLQPVTSPPNALSLCNHPAGQVALRLGSRRWRWQLTDRTNWTNIFFYIKKVFKVSVKYLTQKAEASIRQEGGGK